MGDVVETTSDAETRSFRALIRDQREQVVLRQAVAAAEEGELDHEVDADDGAAEVLDQPCDRLHRAAGRQNVVVDDDPRAASDRACRDLERVLLRRLSAFAGGWTLEAAETVADFARDRKVTQIFISREPAEARRIVDRAREMQVTVVAERRR